MKKVNMMANWFDYSKVKPNSGTSVLATLDKPLRNSRFVILHSIQISNDILRLFEGHFEKDQEEKIVSWSLILDEINLDLTKL